MQQDPDPAGLVGDLEKLETIFATWDEVPRSAVQAYRRALDALNGEALRRLVGALKSDPGALAAMKEAVRDEVVYAVLRYHAIVNPSLNERVEAALESVRPALAAHGGDVRLVKVAPPSIEVELIGSCDGCASAALTFEAGIKQAVQQACPEISDIVQKQSTGAAQPQTIRFASPFARRDEAPK